MKNGQWEEDDDFWLRCMHVPAVKVVTGQFN